MSADLAVDVPFHLALFACGAFGYYATRWANRRLLNVRLSSAADAKGKAVTEGAADVGATEVSSPREPESEPPAERQAAAASQHSGVQEGVEVPLVEATAQVEQEVGSEEVNERVAQLLAKKAARKRRRVAERKQLSEQLAAATPREVQEAASTPAMEEPLPTASVQGQDERAGEEQPAAEAAGCADEETEPEAADRLVEVAEDGAQRGQTVEVPTVMADALAAIRICLVEQLEFDAPTAPAKEVAVPVPLVVGCNPAVAAAVAGFMPVTSPSGQQLYTDGREVYFLACGMAPAPPMVASSREPGYIGMPLAPPVWSGGFGLGMGNHVASSGHAPAPFADDADDSLWGVSWEFA